MSVPRVYHVSIWLEIWSSSGQSVVITKEQTKSSLLRVIEIKLQRSNQALLSLVDLYDPSRK